MQITGGKYRGRKIKPVKNPLIRPSKAVVREALFSILGPDSCNGKLVADFFSGSGIMTLEAVSRGVQAAYSVDNDPGSCTLIRSNFALLKVPSTTILLQMNVLRAITEFSALNLKFDYIFLDPPYDSPHLGTEAIDQSVAAGIVHLDTIAIFEHRSKAEIPECCSMLLWKQKKYGQSMLSFYVMP
jgi:16S rRNA (guanine(966)-N(2))-methyltransferase RsmD